MFKDTSFEKRCRALFNFDSVSNRLKQTLGGCKKKHILKIAETLFEGDVRENISDVNRVTPMIHVRKRAKLSEAVFLSIPLNVTATLTF